MKNIFLFLKILISFTMLISVNLNAAIINVNSVPSMQTAINSSNSGDEIVLADGTYLNNTITIGKSNITVRSATPGGVFLNGSNSITINGNYITFSGFQFTSGSVSSIVIWVYGSHNTITQLNFKGYSAQKYITLISPSQYNEISYCNFENKPTTAPIGNLIHIDPSATVPGYHHIHHCSFQNMPGIGGDNGNECIRISNGATSTYVSRTIIEFNYFNNTGLGDSEAISNKCRENVIRYNTMENNQTAMFCFRNGDNCVAYGNFFINSGGIRVKEANNIYCYNNYFEKAGVGGTMDAVTFVYYTGNTTNVLNNINFIHNTFVDCGNIDLGGIGALNNTWANNIFKKSSGTVFINANSGTTFLGNIYNGNLGITIPSGMQNIDPKLVLNSDGYFGISAVSPAIGSSAVNFPAILDIANVDDDPNVLLDIQGQARPVSLNLKDVGCDQFTTGTVTNKPLKINDVGPVYLKPLTTISSAVEDNLDLLVSLNTSNETLKITFSLESNSKVNLKIIDISGKLIRILLSNKNLLSGQNAITDNVADLSKGIYLIQLSTDKFSKTQKLIINK